jgi:tRNA pseudouridine65 synthase
MLSELVIHYQDDAMVVAEKPSGLLVHRSSIDARERRAMVQMLRDQVGSHVHPVHRLDKATSGLVLFALDASVARDLSEQFAVGTVDKVYRAIVRGHVAADCVVNHALRDEVDHRGQRVKGGVAREAETHLEVLSHWTVPLPVDRYPEGRYSIVRLSPRTGRFRQLRRHMKHISHPIIGDVRYGKGTHNRFFAEQLGFNRLWLHAQALEVRHPNTGQLLRVDTGEVTDFERCLDWLASHAKNSAK